MASTERAYRRWLARRLASHVACGILLAAASAGCLIRNIPLWLSATGMIAGGLGLVPIAAAILQILRCADLHEQGRRAEAHLLRHRLRATRPIIPGGLGLAILLFCFTGFARRGGGHPVPSYAEIHSPLVRNPSLRRGDRPRPGGAPAGHPVHAVPPVRGTVSGDGIAKASGKISPREVPRTGGRPAEEKPPPDGRSAVSRPIPHRGFDPEDRDPLLPILSQKAPAPGFSRVGVPSERGKTPPAPSLDIDVLRLLPGEIGAGAAVSVLLDEPVSPESSFRISFLGGRLSESPEIFEGEPIVEWQRWTLAYEFRPVGYTTKAEFDLAVGFGWSVDVFRSGSGPALDNDPRISPLLSVAMTVWQSDRSGLEIRASHSLPANVTGAATRATDASVTLRFDMLEGVSIRLGYRILVLQLKDFPARWTTEHGREEWEGTLAGPFLGVTFRF